MDRRIAYPKLIALVQRFAHAHRHDELVRHFLFAKGHGAAGHHETLAAFVLQLGHLETEPNISGIHISTWLGLAINVARYRWWKYVQCRRKGNG